MQSPPRNYSSSSAELSTGKGHTSRRELLRAALTGFSGLTLPGLYRLRELVGSTTDRRRTAIILVWLRGGASHLETFDPKPLAPAEFRGPYKPIATNVPGIDICELLPRLSTIADKYAILRSVAHTAGNHPAGTLQILSGDTAAADKPRPIFPDWMTVASYLRPDQLGQLPNYVAVNPVDRYDNFQIAGPAFLGRSYEPFKVTGNPAEPQFEILGADINDKERSNRLKQRDSLRNRLDKLGRRIEQAGEMIAWDTYQAQALNLLISPQARVAFDLSQEPDEIREFYGRHQWGQQCLMARRLVEAGVEIVSTEFDGPLCGRVANWDDHAVNHHVFDAIKYRAPFFDQAISALIEDIYARGLDQQVLVVVTGEFGRTPRISHVASSGKGVASASKGTVQPGRDHWPRANSMLFAGGGIRTGQVIGATDSLGEDPVARRVSPRDFLATIYRHLEMENVGRAIFDRTGQATPILSAGKPISELARTSG